MISLLSLPKHLESFLQPGLDLTVSSVVVVSLNKTIGKANLSIHRSNTAAETQYYSTFPSVVVRRASRFLELSCVR